MTLVVSSTYKFKLGLQMLEKQLPYLMRIQMVIWKFLRLKTKFLTPIQLCIHKRIKVCDHFFYFPKLLFAKLFISLKASFLCRPFKEEGVYCFAHVGLSVGLSTRWFPDDNSRTLGPRIMKLHRYIDHDSQMPLIDFKVTVTRNNKIISG